jgi:hypothetical protein
MVLLYWLLCSQWVFVWQDYFRRNSGRTKYHSGKSFPPYCSHILVIHVLALDSNADIRMTILDGIIYLLLCAEWDSVWQRYFRRTSGRTKYYSGKSFTLYCFHILVRLVPASESNADICIKGLMILVYFLLGGEWDSVWQRYFHWISGRTKYYSGR